MKNKRVLLTVVMMLFSLFIYSRPAHTYAAMSVDATVKEAVSASKNLYWSWSVAGRGDGKVQPYAEYNQTKLKLANAKKAISSLPKSKQAAYKKSLDEVQLQIDRAAVY